ncbi:tRNA (adenosine(37)-N6)-threonylcarbamoyltransferase complex ATPase subunit type 1 TsaE [Patescibacteria group bacterium]|nr:tRNA (adenosine(37)-N6)-threonylcarbamoyltransferase complex ATPase subunit type 1 TsaE [Patescibacteria group bacterium]MBU1034225.1 tRNA (adenosine(37)-N6)-threonylcarbamoyltransferase complex ATPase subunit type 1 TsaE [Patescibacteria group bacterium]MBU1629531.1 tRNA (adenosine(37)-N6)-threonylcarbamoyltransferase complex ATPase subunit type 1 TsaE [Patescibacteria group bacterium]MBU1907547.1 tRNA (adenosine(37)-N6)-threonylcarbamoyltransferase complex ATPase subunit type 1 TsaE [Patesc
MRNVTLKHGKDCKRFRVSTENDWGELAEYVAGKLKPGSIVAISGELGAGKTTFVKALVTALGNRRSVVSPTFALMRSYKIAKRGNLKRLLHLDAYRIEHEHELLALDLDEELGDGHTALVIEWPENISKWVKKQVGVTAVIIK